MLCLLSSRARKAKDKLREKFSGPPQLKHIAVFLSSPLFLPFPFQKQLLTLGILCHWLFDTRFQSPSQMANVTSNNIALACQQLLTFKGSKGALLKGDLAPLWGYLTWDCPAV